jgi:hypothetical protein
MINKTTVTTTETVEVLPTEVASIIAEKFGLDPTIKYEFKYKTIDDPYDSSYDIVFAGIVFTKITQETK